MKTTKTTLVVDTYICDATGTNMVSFSHKAPEKMIGGILQLNSSYCGIADGFHGLAELHLSNEQDVRCIYATKLPRAYPLVHQSPRVKSK